MASMREFRIEVLFIRRIKQYYCVTKLLMGASSEFSIRQKVYSRLGVEIFFLSIMLNN